MRSGRLALMAVAPLCGGAVALLVHDSPSSPPSLPAIESAEAVAAPVSTAVAAPVMDVAAPSTAASAPAAVAPTRPPDPAVLWMRTHLPHVAKGDHYRVRTDVSATAARETLVVLEAAHPHLERRFGRDAPAQSYDGLLPVHLYTHRRRYEESPLADGSPWHRLDDGSPGGGFYDLRGNAHLVEASRPWRDRLAVHEAAHQFHYLTTVPSGRSAGPRWWVEGVAHDIEIEAVPLPAQEDRRLNDLVDGAVRLLHRPGFRLEPLLRGEEVPPLSRDHEMRWRGLGFVLVRFLRYAEGERYAEWFAGFERACAVGSAVPAFPSLAERDDELREAVLRFARTLRPTHRTTTIRYRWAGHETEHRRTNGGTSSRAFLGTGPFEGETTTIRFRLDLPLRSGDAIGVVVGWRGTEAQTVIRLGHYAQRVTVERVEGERRTERTLESLGPKVRTGGDRYEFVLSGDGALSVRRNGFTIGTDTLPPNAIDGDVGLYARAGELREDLTSFRVHEVAIETESTER